MSYWISLYLLLSYIVFFIYVYWVAPNGMNPKEHLLGSLGAALFGFILLPFIVVIIAMKFIKRRLNT
ncbi:hypothetical protein J7384_17160 [Endozoicomonas sp. G2_1]|uniref:hypothetical protein n=1 Tax=Endozoicomonas sp. G2_1 TaxID=2821091 RepID=UPI001ADC9F6E|nr:hypothetical protein [Endozoicomonas sp. G2_1]MBO9492094.1 hypothetical protein [Endozoicomonas sp. G2_1]